MKSDFCVSQKKTVLKQYLYSSQKIIQNVDDDNDDDDDDDDDNNDNNNNNNNNNNNSSPELEIYAPGKEAL